MKKLHLAIIILVNTYYLYIKLIFMRIILFPLIALLVLTLDVSAQQKKYRLPAYETPLEISLRTNKSFSDQDLFLAKNTFEPRTDMRFPGEFEESQAVLISWPDDYDESDFKYLGADTTTEWAFISAQLVFHIQKEVPVWIRVYLADDTLRVKTFLANIGVELNNYKFIVSYGDAWWIRDFGPIGVYYTNQDSLAFIDLKYYQGRDSDDVFPAVVATMMDKPLFTTRLYAEGGNIMSDGFGTTFFGSGIANTNIQPGTHNTVWSKNMVLDTMSRLFNIKNRAELTRLSCDGGTGHIDLYTKMIDEQTIMVVQMPDVITAIDKRRIEDNFQYMTTLSSTYNRPFRIIRIPHPTDDFGNYSARTCNQLNEDPRTFVNGLTVNNTFIFPSYANEQNGNKAQTAEVKKLFEKVMPGYNVVDIDSRAVSPFAGELHCITMQVPAENPVHFWHPSIDLVQPKLVSFPILAKITNKSGINNATCKWRIKGNNNWNSLPLTDSAGYFVGVINSGDLGMEDVIEYYLEATTYNGKTARKPHTAPQGYYSILFQWPTSLQSHFITPQNHLFGAYPNPAQDFVNIDFQSLSQASASILLRDISGRQLAQKTMTASEGLNTCTFDVSDFAKGVYFYTFILEGETIGTRKLVIK
jgi:agmatine deiminase